jgi:hypothetical protein
MARFSNSFPNGLKGCDGSVKPQMKCSGGNIPSADLTPLTDFAVFSIRSLHISQLPATLIDSLTMPLMFSVIHDRVLVKPMRLFYSSCLVYPEAAPQHPR